MTPFDSSGAFRPVAEGGEFASLAVRGAAATLSAAAVSLAVRTVGTVVLARLLTPAEFGVVTMVTTFSLLLANFGLNGFTEAIIQIKEMDHYTASKLFWLNSGAGLVLAVAFAAAGSLLAKICPCELFGLLRPGGYSIMIDMNRSVRFKGSRAHDCLTRSKEQYYIPNLREYSTPFQEAGFSIEEDRRFFCFTRLDSTWMPSQLQTLVLSQCRRLRPIFDLYLPFLAQHTLVIAKKPL